MPRLSVPLTTEQHSIIRSRADDLGIPLAEIARRLLFLWMVGDTPLPQGEDYRALVDAVLDCYAEMGND